MSAEDKVAVKDISFKCSDGIELAAQRWTKSTVDSSTKRLRILCLHGFLDNCRSFYYLAPFLVSSLEDSELVALDFPGHGLSQHATIDNPPIVINDLCYYTAEAIRILNWENYGFMLLGHSMGSVVSLIYAATFPDQVRRLVLIDGYGPDSDLLWSKYSSKHTKQSIHQASSKSLVAERMQRRVKQQHLGNIDSKKNTQKPKRLYKDIQAAVQTRIRTAQLSPGNQWISEKAALELVQRAVVVDDFHRVQFRHDSRVHLPPLLLNTIEQVDSYWSSIQCTVYWLRAEDGWPYPKELLDRAQNLLGNLGLVEYFPGSHHLHADPDTANRVANAILSNIYS